MNLMGSHGSKAVALALLGATVTVADVSPGNQRYAQELAAAAGVGITYIIADVLHIPDELEGRAMLMSHLACDLFIHNA